MASYHAEILRNGALLDCGERKNLPDAIDDGLNILRSEPDVEVWVTCWDTPTLGNKREILAISDDGKYHKTKRQVLSRHPAELAEPIIYLNRISEGAR